MKHLQNATGQKGTVILQTETNDLCEPYVLSVLLPRWCAKWKLTCCLVQYKDHLLFFVSRGFSSHLPFLNNYSEA